MAANANDLRALAERMAVAGGKRITVQPKSGQTVNYALRAYADLISRPAVDDVGPFRVDMWDATGIVETMAKCSNLHVARAAVDRASRERARQEVTLRSGIRVIATNRPETDR